MNFLKRAFRGVWYYKKNSLLLILIFTILSTLILSGMCIRLASQESAHQMALEIGGSVLVQGKDLPESPKEGNRLSLESSGRLAQLDPVTETLQVSHTLACAQDFRHQKPQFDDVPDGDYNLTLMGADGEHPDLRDLYRLLEGRKPQSGDGHVAVVHQWLAEENGWEMGDHITVSSQLDGGTQVELEVIGVYVRNVGYRYGAVCQYVENTIYTDLATVQEISGSTDLRMAEYIVEDPARIPEFLQAAEALELPERDQLNVVPMDGEYRKIAMSLDSLVNIATLIFAASILLGAVILTALVMISLGDREFEIGVLLSMGENKGKIVLQLVLENLLSVLLAVTAGVAVSTWATGFLGGLLGAAERGIQVGLEPYPVLLVYLCGIGLTLLASCVTAYKVCTYQPKKMLMAIE